MTQLGDRMTRPCGTCGGTPAGLYPAGWRCGSHAPAFGGAYTPMPPAPPVRALTRPGPCRFCHRPSWAADAGGGVHPCCLAWQHVIAAGYPCPSCHVAEIVLRQPVHWRDGTIRQVRLPALPPLPRFLPDGTPYAPDPAPAPRCAACGQRMTVIVPGQRTHPLCTAEPPAQTLREAA